MSESTHKPEIILASSSPRRRDLLDLIGIKFRVFEPQVEEIPRGAEKARDYALRNAVEKAHQVARHVPSGGKELSKQYILVAADTIVVLKERILEKPRDKDHARAMLHALSGQRHEVITGLCVLGLGWPTGPREKSMIVRTEVDMKPLTEDEIDSYIASGEPMDKAGAYAVQGRGSYMIRAVYGSYTNVVGLPLSELVDVLEQEFDYSMR
jgi:septum formation protein